MGTLPARIAVIGDVHQEHGALEAALAWLSGREIDLTLCVGDIADGLGDFERCCGLLESARVEVVRGNHDRWLLEGAMRNLSDALPVTSLSPSSRKYLASLPATRTYSTVAGSVLLCHGLGPNDMKTVKEDDFGYELENNDELQSLLRSRAHRIVISGHSHVRMVRHFPEARLTIVNAGTLLRGHAPGFVEADLARAVVQFFDIDAELRVRPSRQHGLVLQP